jgi:POT family proton-dependent oligopeptide transporter
MWKKHPKALPFLFFSEMWERFGYYLMIGIFTLYLKDVKAGFAMTEAESADLYGTFIALVFLTPFLGGLIADRYWGYRKSIIIGGLLMGAGYCLMSIHSLPILYISMTLVIVGNGFFKPNISTLLGNVYTTPQHNHQKDEGYNIFYMGINVGAFICNFFGAVLYNTLGWGYAFAAAGVGMFIGVIAFVMLGTKHYAAFDIKKGVKEGDMSMGKITALILLPSIISRCCRLVIAQAIFLEAIVLMHLFLLVFLLYFFIFLYTFKADADEKAPIGVLLTIFAVVVMFWAVFKQNGTALNTWADRYTDRSVSWYNRTII